MKAQVRALAAGVQFLTRIPTPTLAYDPNDLARSTTYFPLIGAVVGLAGAAVYWLATAAWPPFIAATLAVAATGFGGMFAIFSYIASTVTEVTMLASGLVSIVLVIFGLGMNVGNLVGSKLADSFLMGTIGGMLILNMAVMTAFGYGAGNVWILFSTVFLVGCGFAAGPAVQTRLMDVAHEGQSLAAALNHSTLNIANALGAWLGSIVLAAGLGYEWPSRVGAFLAVLGVVIALGSALTERSARRAAA